MFFVRFWGVRGSMPCPGSDTYRYGGNTACLEIRAGKTENSSGGRLVIIDCGTGIRLLGEELMKKDYYNSPIDADIFITHTHWDHIMGFPMFNPIFEPSTNLRIRGPVISEEDSLENIIGTQLSYKFWPVRQSELASKIEYDKLKETSFDLGDGLRVTTKYLNHSILCMGYRFEYQGKSIVTAFDHEPFRNLFPSDPSDPNYDEGATIEGEEAAREENDKILEFIKNADILIYDSQYTAAEYKEHKGWGHSSFDLAIETAKKANVKKLVFFHHDPGRTDKQLNKIEKQYQKISVNTDVLMAREGLTIEV